MEQLLAPFYVNGSLDWKPVDGLCCKVINWFYVKGQLKLNSLKEMKNTQKDTQSHVIIT